MNLQSAYCRIVSAIRPLKQAESHLVLLSGNKIDFCHIDVKCSNPLIR